MGTEINVTVDSGGLLERSKLQAAANRQAFVEGQQRSKAEETGNEQRLERLAAEGRDAQGSLILPRRARQSALDRLIPKPAARRQGGTEGLTIYYGKAEVVPNYEAGELVGHFWTKIAYLGNVTGGVPLTTGDVFTDYTTLSGVLDIDGELPVLASDGYPYTYIGISRSDGAGGLERVSKGFAVAQSQIRWTYITDVYLTRSNFEYFYTSVIILVNTADATIELSIDHNSRLEYNFVAPAKTSGYRINVRIGGADNFSFFYVPLNTAAGWIRSSVTVNGTSLYVHQDGVLVGVVSIPGIPAVQSLSFRQDRSASKEDGAGSFGYGLTRLIPKAVFGPTNHVVVPMLNIR